MPAGITDRRWLWLGGAGLAAAVGVYLYLALGYRHYINDDAYITFRYSLFLASGRGPYFNVGEAVEGYTNFSLMLAIAAAIRLFGASAAPLVAKSIGLFSGVGSVALSFVLSRRLLSGQIERGPVTLAAMLAAGLVAVSSSFALNSMSGLETTLFGFLLVLGAYLALRSADEGRWCGAGVAFALAAWTRPEGALLFALFWSAQALRRSSWRGPALRRSLADLALVTAAVAAQLAYRLAMYGDWLPNTYHAKAEGFWRIDAWSYIVDGAARPVLGIAGLLLATLGFVLRPAGGMRFVPLAVMAIVGSLLPFVTGPDWMYGWRLVIPFLPLLAVIFAGGLARLVDRISARYATLVLAVALVVVPVQWFLDAVWRERFQVEITATAEGYRTGHRALADWLREEAARPGDTVALMDIGQIGFLCPELRILDVTGLTDREIARSPGPFLNKDYDPAYVLDQRPEFIVLVATAPGESYTAPHPDTRFSFWSDIEPRLYTAPQFQRDYLHRPAVPPSGANWHDGVGYMFGADALFEHGHERSYYLLLVFGRNDADRAG